MIRLAIVGTGHITAEVIPYARQWGWDMTALCATPRSKEKMEALCAAYHIPNGFTSYPALLESGCCDAVYLGVPNHLHYDMVRQALEAGLHVIVEKPITSNITEAESLWAMARERRLFLFEAITTLHLPNYHKIRSWLPRLGEIKGASLNYSQYSSRYDSFCAGEIHPVFDPAKSGGALMDLNLYNLHYLLGLFGAPAEAHYLPNLERGIDTSGLVTLRYPGFSCSAFAAKDSVAPLSCVIQGTKGYLVQDSAPNFCLGVTLHLHDGTVEHYDCHPESRMEPEFRAFEQAIRRGDYAFCEAMMERTLEVCRVMTAVRLEAGIRFPADR